MVITKSTVTLALTALLISAPLWASTLGSPGKSKTAPRPKAQKEEPVRVREIYSAMEPEPGPGTRLPKKQTLKSLDQFDPVPVAQREPISRRLRLIEKLILEHGRAYDYRSITLAELNSILAHLDSPHGRIRPQASEQADENSDQTEASSETKKKITLPNLAENRPEARAEDESAAADEEAPLPPAPRSEEGHQESH